MNRASAALLERVLTTEPLLRALTEAHVAWKPAADRWSKKEILGHLIDSACNNHQRFVRAQLEGSLSFPGYEQTGWVRCQGYRASEWGLLVDLWAAYNRHLAHLIARLPEAAHAAECRIGEGPPVTLSSLVEDYVRHLDHHLQQLTRPTTPPNY